MKIEIKNLHVEVEGKEILKGVNLEIIKGEITAIMGPNGSGKSTLANTLMGHPKYKVTKGQILLDGEDITNAPANERAKKGLFLSFQYPSEISGVRVSSFLRTAYNAVTGKDLSVVDFHKLLKEKMSKLNMDSALLKRSLNEGFSGGEKKKCEILQLITLNPKYALLDETDSGTDVDALKVIADGIKSIMDKDMGILVITHYYRFLDYLTPNKTYIMQAGKIIKQGGPELAKQIEEQGYQIAQ
ncbi:MAG: Fe-S cluster assembly ATPase SufC [Candidatus Nanoarchaeia archaeon]|nr:Fe-S cluster assembly ATPase SufC [Candidatus Nanoarchaeia archaeon]